MFPSKNVGNQHSELLCSLLILFVNELAFANNVFVSLKSERCLLNVLELNQSEFSVKFLQ